MGLTYCAQSCPVFISSKNSVKIWLQKKLLRHRRYNALQRGSKSHFSQKNAFFRQKMAFFWKIHFIQNSSVTKNTSYIYSRKKNLLKLWFSNFHRIQPTDRPWIDKTLKFSIPRSGNMLRTKPLTLWFIHFSKSTSTHFSPTAPPSSSTSRSPTRTSCASSATPAWTASSTGRSWTMSPCTETRIFSKRSPLRFRTLTGRPSTVSKGVKRKIWRIFCLSSCSLVWSRTDLHLWITLSNGSKTFQWQKTPRSWS